MGLSVLCWAGLLLSIALASAQECRSALGRDYRGTLSRTVSGRVCQRWNSQYPHTHSQEESSFPFNSFAANENYCRNPDGHGGGLWCYTTDPAKRWEHCYVALCSTNEECRRTVIGHDYTGNVSRTVNGRECQRWDRQFPHSHSQEESNFAYGSFTASENYCRNPDSYNGGLWCYTTDPSRRWESCYVRICSNAADCKRTTLGRDYRGSLSRTVNGRECQRWDRQFPHAHEQEESNFPYGSATANENYCRNPDSYDGGLWCYTTDPAKRWELCYVPPC